MLDYITIVRKNGVVLWSHSFSPGTESAVNALICNVLLEERGGTMDVYYDDSSAVKWHIDNEMDLLVAAVYQRTLSLGYVDECCRKPARLFAPCCGACLPRVATPPSPLRVLPPLSNSCSARSRSGP